MALRPLLLSVVIGIAALGAFHAPAAEASGYISINVGTSGPNYRAPYSYGNYGVRHDPRGYNHSRYNQSRYDQSRYDQSRYNQTRYSQSRYDHGRYQRAGYTFVPGHWAYGQRGRVWVPDQYVQVQPRYDPRHDHRDDTRVIYRRAPRPAPLPGGFYDQRGG